MTLFFLLFFSSCGYSKEEKQYMKQIEESGKVNAINYIRDKYGFTPKIISVEICKDGPDGDPFPSANGDVRVTMSHESKTFTVKISGENPVEISGEKPEEKGRDDYQYDQITQDAKEYFEMLLGCDIYDFYLEYKEKEISDSVYSYEEKNLIHQLYEAGSFEDFLKNYPANIRIDDCINKDLTSLPEDNPDAETFFQIYSKNYRMKAILISYKSVAENTLMVEVVLWILIFGKTDFIFALIKCLKMESQKGAVFCSRNMMVLFSVMKKIPSVKIRYLERVSLCPRRGRRGEINLPF